MSYFHCKIIDGIRECIKVEEIDPVTPIPEADFVTGNVTNPLVGSQEIFIYQYSGGLAVNGDTDGVIDGTDNAFISLKGELLINTDPILILGLLGEGNASEVVTTDATVTLAGQLPIKENLTILISIVVEGTRVDGGSEDIAFFEYRYTFMRITGGSLIRLKEILIAQDRTGNMNAELVVNSNNIELEIKGRNAEEWKWGIAEFKYTASEIA